jgi:putative hemolysin
MEGAARIEIQRGAAAVLPEVLSTAGELEVRLARGPEDVLAAQRLRYQVFYEEMSAQPTPQMAAARRDFDAFDEICDILLVVDPGRAEGDSVVGTYRLLRQDVAMSHGGFYSSSEYDLGPLLGQLSENRRGLELGRSCVHPAYRTNATIQLLWRGIASYLGAHRIAYMFGCASLPGTDPVALAPQLAFLRRRFLAPAELRVRALPDRYVLMDFGDQDELSERRAMKALPPLVKGYLRLGCFVGDGAVIDRQFGTTDIFIILPVERIRERYFSHFSKPGAIAQTIGSA